MGAVRKLDIQNRILEGAKVLGNSKSGFKEICSNLIDDAIKRGEKLNSIAERCYLLPSTVERMRSLKEAESGADYRPSNDTVERVLRAFDADVTLSQTRITKRFQNKPKVDV